jgi:hypothetical protein
VYRQQLLDEFLAHTVPSFQKIGQRGSTHDANTTWLAMLPFLPDLTTALETSVLAICTATLGRKNNNPVLVRESLKFYIQGLWELQRALWDPKLMYRDETLAACMMLIFYEVSECPDKTIAGWLSHMSGCAKLFELRGPDAYDSELGHQLFLSFRLLEVITLIL